MLQATLAATRGNFTLDLELEAEPASTLVLVGESGSGKTTALRLLAGLLRPQRGGVVVGETVWYDSAAQVWVPVQDRSVGYVAQDYALFPHLSVAENVAFGLRAVGLPRMEVRRRVGELLDRFELASFAGRHPAQLSGGQQQRVALARSLALEPDLLLLDEPLSALDVETRQAVRGEMKRLLSGLRCVTVFVTHAPMEALVFGDRIAVLEQGRVAQVGDRLSLLRQPRTRYVATLLGLNLLPGKVTARGPGEEVTLETPRGSVTVMQAAAGDDLFVAVSPDQVTLSVAPPAASARNVFTGVIEELLPEPPYGDRVRVVLGPRPAPPFVAEVTAAAAAELGLEVGRRVYASFKATSITAYS